MTTALTVKDNIRLFVYYQHFSLIIGLSFSFARVGGVIVRSDIMSNHFY